LAAARETTSETAVVLGLGNPGPRYSETRHNVGFCVVEALAGRWNARPEPANGAYRAWRSMRDGRRVALLEPLTFMNVSGEALSAWRDRHGLAPEALVVVVDDVHLPVGIVRVRARGSSGGHRGLDSVEAALGTREYARVRVGVGAAGTAAELREHVLDTFAPAEMEAARAAIGTAADAVECWIDDGIVAAMNRFNRRVRKEVPEP
jgi:PTH1 family peptidyl-tRNA hydrolase